MDSEWSLASLFCSNNNTVAALQTSCHADVSHMLFLLPTVTFSFFSWFFFPSSTIILSSSLQTLLCFHDTCTSTCQIKIFSNLFSYILGGLVDHISLKWNVSKWNKIFLRYSAFVWSIHKFIMFVCTWTTISNCSSVLQSRLLPQTTIPFPTLDWGSLKIVPNKW